MKLFSSVLIALLVVAGSFVTGSVKGEETSPATQAAAPADSKPLKLAFVTNNASAFWTIARAGTKKAEAEIPNITVDFRIPSDGTAATQQQLVQNLLAGGIDGIAISPVDPANQLEMLNNAAQQALLITHDSDATGSNRACYVGTDNIAAGRQAGDQVKKALPNGGKIMVFVGKLSAQNARDRYQGLKESLQGSKIEILDCRTDDTDRVRAKANVVETIVKYPDIAGLVGLWSYNGPAILNGVNDAHQIGKIKIVCFDEEEETLEGIKEGAIDATIVQQPYEFGRQAITLMAKVLRGDKAAIPESKKIIVPTLVIDKSNLDEFWQKLNKLRKP